VLLVEGACGPDAGDREDLVGDAAGAAADGCGEVGLCGVSDGCGGMVRMAPLDSVVTSSRSIAKSGEPGAVHTRSLASRSWMVAASMGRSTRVLHADPWGASTFAAALLVYAAGSTVDMAQRGAHIDGHA